MVCKIFSFVRAVTESQSGKKKVGKKFDLDNMGQGHGFYIQSTIFFFFLNSLFNYLSENIYIYWAEI